MDGWFDDGGGWMRWRGVIARGLLPCALLEVGRCANFSRIKKKRKGYDRFLCVEKGIW